MTARGISSDRLAHHACIHRHVVAARGARVLFDEVPMVYKDIEEVMAAQTDLVEPLARIDPRLVKMAPSGEPAED